MDWIYLSPHYDDIALSAAGLVWEQKQRGHAVQIWTLCGGEPPNGTLSPFAQSLHERWQTGSNAVYQRQVEDIDSCQAVGAAYRHFPLPDCIYRYSTADGHFYASEEAIFGAIHPAEYPLVAELAELLRREAPAQANLVCPLALGGHVDHRLVRAAAEQSRLRLWYYADYPYILKEEAVLQAMLAGGWRMKKRRITPRGLAAWQRAVAAHKSQLSTFWPDDAAMCAAMRTYWQPLHGIGLWRNPSKD
jgi:LmbE family N-acetylglucosaminyl deacetylase